MAVDLEAQRVAKKRYREANKADIAAKAKAKRKAMTEDQRERERSVARAYYARNKDACRARTHAYRSADPVRSRAQVKRYRNAKLLKFTGAQSPPDRCEACGSNRKICVDHCHATGAFRGWLCHHCNLILGHASDDPERLRALAAYIEERSASCAATSTICTSTRWRDLVE